MSNTTSAPTPKCDNCPTRSRSVFCELDDRGLDALSSSKSGQRFRKGETLYIEGDTPAGLYCVSSGNIKVFKSGRDGKELIIRFARPGDIVGYRALLSGESHANSAAAIGDAHVCFVPRAAFFSVATDSTSLTARLFSLLSQELRAAQDRILGMAQRPLHERVAETLLFLHESFGLELDGRTLNVRLTRREISDVVGSATESVIRTLSDFKRDGVINIKGKAIEILDHVQLVRAASIED